MHKNDKNKREKKPQGFPFGALSCENSPLSVSGALTGWLLIVFNRGTETSQNWMWWFWCKSQWRHLIFHLILPFVHLSTALLTLQLFIFHTISPLKVLWARGRLMREVYPAGESGLRNPHLQRELGLPEFIQLLQCKSCNPAWPKCPKNLIKFNDYTPRARYRNLKRCGYLSLNAHFHSQVDFLLEYSSSAGRIWGFPLTQNVE